MKKLQIFNMILLVLIMGYLIIQHVNSDKKFIAELEVERLDIVGKDKNLYMAISNPERQALATLNGVPMNPGSRRDMPGIIFFNRVGDEVGGIYYDGTSEESYAGITFDQQKNDQIMAIMKDEYFNGSEWKRWYGMFLRERVDSVRVETLFHDFHKRTKDMNDARKKAEYLKFKKYLDENINKYRMFLGREEDENVGLFLYDSKSRERIKVYIDDKDVPRLEILDTLGNVSNLIDLQ